MTVTVPVTAIMQSATPMKTDNVLASACIPFIDDTNDEADFEMFNEAEETISPVQQKRRTISLTTADILVLHNRDIQAFVGPSRLYLLLKGMKLDNLDVTTIKFVGQVPRLDITLYVSRRPNITRVITDTYGPIACTWPEFETVRKNLTSFVVRSGDEYLDVCHFIDF